MGPRRWLNTTAVRVVRRRSRPHYVPRSPASQNKTPASLTSLFTLQQCSSSPAAPSYTALPTSDETQTSGAPLPAYNRCVWPALASSFSRFASAGHPPSSSRHDEGVQPLTLLWGHIPEAVRDAHGAGFMKSLPGQEEPTSLAASPSSTVASKQSNCRTGAWTLWTEGLGSLQTSEPSEWRSHVEKLTTLEPIQALRDSRPAEYLRRWHDILFSLTRNQYLNPQRGGTATSIPIEVCDSGLWEVIRAFYSALGDDMAQRFLSATAPAVYQTPRSSESHPFQVVWVTRMPVVVWRRLAQCYRSHEAEALSARLFQWCVLKEEEHSRALEATHPCPAEQQGVVQVCSTALLLSSSVWEYFLSSPGKKHYTPLSGSSRWLDSLQHMSFVLPRLLPLYCSPLREWLCQLHSSSASPQSCAEAEGSSFHLLNRLLRIFFNMAVHADHDGKEGLRVRDGLIVVLKAYHEMLSVQRCCELPGDEWWTMLSHVIYQTMTDKLIIFSLRCVDAWVDVLTAVVLVEAVRFESHLPVRDRFATMQLLAPSQPNTPCLTAQWESLSTYLLLRVGKPGGLQLLWGSSVGLFSGDTKEAESNYVLSKDSYEALLKACRFALLCLCTKALTTLDDYLASTLSQASGRVTTASIQSVDAARLAVSSWGNRIGSRLLGLQSSLHLERLWQFAMQRAIVQNHKAEWSCGCGYQFNSTRTFVCAFCVCQTLQVRAWTCPGCRALNNDSTNCATCGQLHPALLAMLPHQVDEDSGSSVVVSRTLDGCCSCEAVEECCMDEDGQCTHRVIHRVGDVLVCDDCGAVNVENESLLIRYCTCCATYTLFSTSSKVSSVAKCSQCGEGKGYIDTGVLAGYVTSYFTWKCGCGSTNSPLHRHCWSCTTKSREQSEEPHYCFTCPSCLNECSATADVVCCEHCKVGHPLLSAALHDRRLTICRNCNQYSSDCSATSKSCCRQCNALETEPCYTVSDAPWRCLGCGWWSSVRDATGQLVQRAEPSGITRPLKEHRSIATSSPECSSPPASSSWPGWAAEDPREQCEHCGTLRSLPPTLPFSDIPSLTLLHIPPVSIGQSWSCTCCKQVHDPTVPQTHCPTCYALGPLTAHSVYNGPPALWKCHECSEVRKVEVYNPSWQPTCRHPGCHGLSSSSSLQLPYSPAACPSCHKTAPHLLLLTCGCDNSYRPTNPAAHALDEPTRLDAVEQVLLAASHAHLSATSTPSVTFVDTNEAMAIPILNSLS